MERISRRSFTRRVAAMSLMPAFISPPRSQSEAPPIPLPDTVAGYTPDDAEREAMKRFIGDQEKALAPLRAVALPNHCAPALVFHPLRPKETASSPERRK